MKMMKYKLSDPAFIAAVFVLLVNDWLLKQAFHSALTGKVSDFAGLFGFSFFLAALFPRRVKAIHFMVALFFVYWKTEASQPLIDLLHAAAIPVARVADGTDLIALSSVAFSYLRFRGTGNFRRLKPLFVNIIVIISSCAFMATSVVRAPLRHYVYNKDYLFSCSRDQLISCFNATQMDYINKFKGYADFESRGGVFRFTNSKDTIAYLIDARTVSDNDTVYYKPKFAKILFTGNGKTSSLRLISLESPSTKKDPKANALKLFERSVIKNIRPCAR